MQLIALDPGARVAQLETVDGPERGRVGDVAADLVGAALAAPDAIVGRLDAGHAVGQEFAELLVRRHAAGRGVVEAAHVLAVVRVVGHEDVARDLADRQADRLLLVPDALEADARVQALAVVAQLVAAARCVPVDAVSEKTGCIFGSGLTFFGGRNRSVWKVGSC